ncbi:hypothetical protein C0991_007094 [Blastosporella zonata]|nr:hypothetical protein C0991_007094 [Blastosporella zonata]
MSSQSLLGLPPVSATLKPITPFLQRANEIRTQDPVMAYWCAYYAAQLGISLKANDPASRDVLFALLGFLERLKKEIGPTDALDIESVSSAYAENFAFRVFGMADNEDRTGSATRATAKKFLAAAHFLEVLKIFTKDEISESVEYLAFITPSNPDHSPIVQTEEKIKYAKWKAADIAKAFREGRTPAPGPADQVHEDLQEATPASPGIRTGDTSIIVHDSSETFDEGSDKTTRVFALSTDAPLAAEPQTPPRFTGAHHDVGPYGPGALEGGDGEVALGIWSTAATPGAERAPSESEAHVSPPSGMSSLGVESAEHDFPKQKAWVSDEPKPESRSDYHHDIGDKGLEMASDESFKNSASSSTPSSPLHGQQDHPDSYGETTETSWPSEDSIVTQPGYPPATSVETLSPGFVPDKHSAPYANTASSSPVPPAPRDIPHPTSYQPGHVPSPIHDNVYVTSVPPPLPTPLLQTFELTPSIIAKVQKHCRFAISSLDYEDAQQARKELRAALAILGE